jgi:cytochrome b pre-mRNA-processing protein 3
MRGWAVLTSLPIMNIARPAQPARQLDVPGLSLISRLFRSAPPRGTFAPLYEAIVAAGRDPAWYREGGVPDTVDGRFDMIAALTALVLLRLEAEGESGREPSVLLTELFIADMDSSLRQMGVGDYVVGKHVGRMMGALGGRLSALRAAADQDMLAAALERNLYRGEVPSPESLAFVTGRLEAFRQRLGETGLDALIDGKLPSP